MIKNGPRAFSGWRKLFFGEKIGTFGDWDISLDSHTARGSAQGPAVVAAA